MQFLTILIRFVLFIFPSSSIMSADGSLLSSLSLNQKSHKFRIEALFLDCDGTIAETEIPITLQQFNEAFRVYNQIYPSIPLITWSENEYEQLLKTGNSKQRYLSYFESKSTLWPSDVLDGKRSKQKFVEDMQRLKNEQFDTVLAKALQSCTIMLRPGVKQLVDDAILYGIPIAICSNSNTAPVKAIARKLLGIDVPVYGGDLFERIKPFPDMYINAASELKIKFFDQCVVIEDSLMGLSAAKSAGMKCIVTKSRFTVDEDFSAADFVCDDLLCADIASIERIDKLLFDNLV